MFLRLILVSPGHPRGFSKSISFSLDCRSKNKILLELLVKVQYMIKKVFNKPKELEKDPISYS